MYGFDVNGASAARFRFTDFDGLSGGGDHIYLSSGYFNMTSLSLRVFHVRKEQSKTHKIPWPTLDHAVGAGSQEAGKSYWSSSQSFSRSKWLSYIRNRSNILKHHLIVPVHEGPNTPPPPNQKKRERPTSASIVNTATDSFAVRWSIVSLRLVLKCRV